MIVIEKSSNLLDFPWEGGSESSWASLDEHLLK